MADSKILADDMRLEFILLMTDYLKGHWEDPGWGRRDSMLYGAIHELANKLDNVEARTAIQKVTGPQARTLKISG